MNKSKAVDVVAIILAVVAILTFAVGLTLISIWWDEKSEAERLARVADESIPYRTEVVAGASKDLGIDEKDITHVQYMGETLYIITTSVNAYLVGVNIENGAVTYVDVEEELIK